MVENIEFAGRLYAIIIRAHYDRPGVNFLTHPLNYLQMGVHQRRKNDSVIPHYHNNREIAIVTDVQEVLHMEYGKVAIDFFNMNGKELGSTILDSGDTILLLHGGHGLRILENCKMIEVKQGPYKGKSEDKELLCYKDAVHFGPEEMKR